MSCTVWWSGRARAPCRWGDRRRCASRCGCRTRRSGGQDAAVVRQHLGLELLSPKVNVLCVRRADRRRRAILPLVHEQVVDVGRPVAGALRCLVLAPHVAHLHAPSCAWSCAWNGVDSRRWRSRRRLLLDALTRSTCSAMYQWSFVSGEVPEVIVVPVTLSAADPRWCRTAPAVMPEDFTSPRLHAVVVALAGKCRKKSIGAYRPRVRHCRCHALPGIHGTPFCGKHTHNV